MRKLRLSDWASIAEITGTIAVVVSLLLVAYSLERNTTAVSGQYVNEIYDATREISQILLVNPELASIIERGHTNFASFSESEVRQYEQYLGLHLDIWERAITRENEGLIDEQAVAGWHKYYGEFFRRYMTRDLWERMRWQWTDPELFQRVDSALSGENI